jgi:xanthine dehydrogenase molybdopterin-binding subunit B
MTFAFPMWGNFAAMVSIYAQDGTVAVTHVGIEMGQGINTKVSLVGFDVTKSMHASVVIYTVCIC